MDVYTKPEEQVYTQNKFAHFNKYYTIISIVIYLGAMLAMLYFIFFVHLHPKKTVTYVVPKQTIQAHAFLPDIPSGGIVKKVYADQLPVKMEQVFSYPVKDVPIAPSIKPKKEVVGFIPYWDLTSLDKLRTNEITTANLFGVEPDGEGNIIITNSKGQADGGWSMWTDQRLPPFIDLLKKKEIKVNITVKMFTNPHINSLLASVDAQKKLISNLLYMVGSKNLDGVNLDFEYTGTTPIEVRNGFTNFVTNLSAELKRQFPDSTLTIDTYASSGVDTDLFDLATLSRITDAFIIMGYDFHTPYTDPGPVAPLTGEKSVVSYLANYLIKVPAEKIILGVPYYGYDWEINNPTPNSTNILSYADIAEESASNPIVWDYASQTPWYQYTDEKNIIHKVYFENVRSLGLKYDLVNERKLKGIGIWAVGYEGLQNDLDQLISQKFGF